MRFHHQPISCKTPAVLGIPTLSAGTKQEVVS